jgi:F-type H+-transporting ATPase subunit delta
VARIASAKRYAQAVFSLAVDRNEVEKWRADLRAIAAALLDPELEAILEDPKIHLEDKKRLIDGCLPDLKQLALNFAYLLVARQTLRILREVVPHYERMADARQGLEHATVVTAVAFDEQDKEMLATHLAAITGNRIVLAADVDPSIIGGFTARIGDKLIDASIRARLQALKQRLISAA